MKILFFTRLFYPHTGGVEKHVLEVSKSLTKKGYEITVLTEKYDKNLKNREVVDNVKIVRFSYPHIKFLGLKFIWWKIFKNRNLIEKADVIHIHDVFIWYLPFKILYPQKRIIITVHGLEWDRPLKVISVVQKRIGVMLSNKSVGVGDFLKKYIKVKFDLMIYGAATIPNSTITKNKNTITYVGRLEENTGILKFLEWAKQNPRYKIDFCGDGPLREQCEKYGTVHGFCDPTPYLKKAEYCVPGGYLAALEGLAANCKLKLFWNNKVKEDYWKMSPFYKLKGKELTNWAKQQTWEKLADQYLALYNEH